MRLTGFSDVTLRPLRPSTATASSETASTTAAAAAKNNLAEGIVTTRSVGQIKPPVDNDRVAEIRKAIQDGRYPILPVEIADAMIAARLYGIIER